MSDSNPADLAERVKEAIFAGRKIEAIKLHREQTGLGLKESKDAVEKLEQDLRISSPDRFSASPAKGCLSMIAALGAVLIWRLVA